MDSQDPELENLFAFYSDLDPEVVKRVWEESGHDYKAAMEALAIIARNPAQAAARQQLAVSTRAPGQEPESMSAGAAAAAAAVGTTGEGYGFLSMGENSGNNDHRASTSAVSQDTWDVSVIGDALNTVGVSVLQAATSVTGWIADLASAFDSGWGDDEDDEDVMPQPAAKVDDTAVVTAGGLDAGRLQQRRQVGGSGTSGGASSARGHLERVASQPQEEEEGDYEDEYDEEDFKKDA